MRQTTYQNAILTVIALLLAGLLWVRLADRPALVESVAAAAPDSSDLSGSNSESFVNSGMRQQQILEATNQMKQQTVEALQRIENKLEATNRLLQNGQFKVQVSNLNEIQIQAANQPRE